MKVLAAVMSCVAHEPRHSVIWDTWGHELAKAFDLFFFTGPLLGIPDDYNSLDTKTKAICRWAANRDYDYLCRIDTDTYIHTNRLVNSGFERYDYTGYVRPDYTPEYCYGPCYWLSRDAFFRVSESRHTCPYEDVLVGEILDGYIKPEHDERYSHWHPVRPDNDKITEHLNSTGGYSDERMYRAHKVAHGLA